MDKVLIIGCRKAMDDICIGCSRCLVSFNRREAFFELYEVSDAEVMGMLSCGDCPGSTIVTRLAQVKLWNAPLGEQPTVIHIGPCIVEHCPHAETIIGKIKKKAGIPVIEGTHTYMPPTIWGS